MKLITDYPATTTLGAVVTIAGWSAATPTHVLAAVGIVSTAIVVDRAAARLDRRERARVDAARANHPTYRQNGLAPEETPR